MADDVVERIKAQLDIVSVISEHINLTRKGKHYWGICPFHAEKDASFSVNPERQIYKCFGCNEGGDVFNFIMKFKRLSFVEVLEEFSERTGIPLERRSSPHRDKDQAERKMLHGAGKAAMEFFIRQLHTPQGRMASDYLKSRGLSAETIASFGLGYAPDAWDALLRHLRQQGISDALAFKAGLLLERKSGGFYDRFRNRVMFPIRDLGGEVIAFGGRIIGEGEPKYLNSPETPVFEKRKILYNLAQAKTYIPRNGAVIVEGYMDVISLANAGFAGAVAPMGTALGEEQIRLLQRFTKDVTLVFDGDEAGRKATLRVSEAFFKTEIIPKVVLLPGGMDPDDMARKNISLWRELIAQARPIWDFIFDESFSGRDPSKLDDQSIILRDLTSMISNLRDPVTRDLLVERLAVRLGISNETVIRQIQVRGEAVVAVRQEQPNDIIEETLIRLMLFDKEALSLVKRLDLAGKFEQKETLQLVRYIVEHGNCILNDMDCPDSVRMIAADLIAKGDVPGEKRKALIEVTTRFMERIYDKELQKIQQALSQAERNHDLEKTRTLAAAKMEKKIAMRKIKTTVTEVLENR